MFCFFFPTPSFIRHLLLHFCCRACVFNCYASPSRPFAWAQNCTCRYCLCHCYCHGLSFLKFSFVVSCFLSYLLSFVVFVFVCLVGWLCDWLVGWLVGWLLLLLLFYHVRCFCRCFNNFKTKICNIKKFKQR